MPLTDRLENHQVDHHHNVIEVKDVSFSYGAREVLRDVSLNVHQGDYLGLVGRNGAGKTTLLRIMLGLLKPEKGSIKLSGGSGRSGGDHQSARIAYVPQQAADFDANFPATVEAVVLMGRYGQRGLARRLTASDREAVDEALRLVGLTDRREAMIGSLSGGQRQRALIARALASEPEIMFLDEPTTGVDRPAQDDFYALLRRLNQELGLTLVLVSHDLERIVQEAMHIACIDGRLVCHDSPAEFLKDSESLEIFGQKVKVITHHHE